MLWGTRALHHNFQSLVVPQGLLLLHAGPHKRLCECLVLAVVQCGMVVFVNVEAVAD